jgi:hypothetical protein
MENRLKFTLNIPDAVHKRSREIVVNEKHPALLALDAGKDVILLESNLYLANDWAAAIGIAWAENRRMEACFFAATDWGGYAKKNKSPTDYHDSFESFLLKPDLLIVVGLSYMKTAYSRQQMDDMLHRRVLKSKVNLIAGWNMPAGDFSFEAGVELADNMNSEFPMLHQRARHPSMSLMLGVGNG